MNVNEVYSREDEVRDNETDLQGIVNNSNYFVYMAHARHKHLKALGIDFAKAFEDGYSLVVAEANLKYKVPLVAGDEYIVTSKVASTSRIKVIIEQEVIRKSDNKVSVVGLITATCLNVKTGRPGFPDEIKAKFGM